MYKVQKNFVYVFCAALIWWQTPVFANVFGSSETAFTDLSPFPKWTGTLERNVTHQEAMKQHCTVDSACNWRKWQALLQRMRSQDRTQQLHTINREMNGNEYILDIVNWGVRDYWETPQEFFSRYGDCEDYAIAKYMSLKALGVPRENMRVVVLNDENLGVLHAVLAVYQGGKVFILDNQIQQVLEDRDIRHYSPIYSINELGWWRHLP